MSTKFFAAFVCVASIFPLTASADSAASLAGDYDGGGATLSFGKDGTYHVLQGTQAMVTGTYTTRSADEVVLTDVSGQFACTPAAKASGTYTWHVEGDALTLKKVTDACDDRSADLTATKWRKK